MIIKTFKQPVKGVIGITYVFGEDKFKIGSEASYYDFPTECINDFIKALKQVKRYSKKKIKKVEENAG